VHSQFGIADIKLIRLQALHVPVINIPGFAGENGMPIGLTLVAPRYHDRKLLVVSEAIGELFEKSGGWK
jgi:NCS1 family nucleobase:cation symporter-1